jgi:hypothetical protein
MIWVIKATALPQYRLHLKFSDGKEGEVDLMELIHADKRPIVTALQDPREFAAIRVDMDTVVWNNGFDLAPEYLYDRLVARAAA